MKIEIEIPEISETEIVESAIKASMTQRTMLINEIVEKCALQWMRDNTSTGGYFRNEKIKKMVYERMDGMLKEIVEEQSQRRDEVAAFVFEKMTRKAEANLNKILKAKE